jgi:beta-galactosidase
VIAVKVDNSLQPNCRWYSGSGIYRHTWLLVTNKVHIAWCGTFVTTPVVDEKLSVIQVETTVQNEGQSKFDCTLRTSIMDKEGKLVQSDETCQSIAAGGNYEFVQQLKIEQPNLWSVEDPYLYTIHSQLSDATGIVDVYETKTGIRTTVFDADKGFLLNGKQVKLNGVCLHHEVGPVGAAVPEQVWRRRLEKLKTMGCNSIRASHNPYAPEFMDMCDEYGFLVMDEIFDEWKEPKRQTPDFGYRIYFDEWSERDVTNFVRRDRNHPSNILWSAGNEIDDQAVPAGVETLRRLVEIFHREDPTRMVAVCCNLIGSTPRGASPEFLAQADVVGYNYVNGKPGRTEKYYSIDKQAYPQRRFVGSEDGSLGNARGDYTWLFPQVIKEVPGGHDDPLMKTIRNSHDLWHEFEQMWKFVKINDYVAGNYMWTGIDYLGECQWPQKTNTAGVLDSCSFEKDSYYWCQSQWTEKPMVHLLPHWNWPGKEDEYIPVLCYTNCDCVELFLNGKSLGIQGYWFPRTDRFVNPARYAAPCTTSDLHLKWTVPWQPGTLKAVGYKNGKIAVKEEISTTGKPAAIGLSIDRNNLTADSRDVAHVTVTVLDIDGRVVPVADNEITFKIEGAGRLIGLDNGNPFSHEDFKGTKRKAFNGLCLAVVQSTNKPGTIKLTATSPKLKSATVAITTA